MSQPAFSEARRLLDTPDLSPPFLGEFCPQHLTMLTDKQGPHWIGWCLAFAVARPKTDSPYGFVAVAAAAVESEPRLEEAHVQHLDELNFDTIRHQQRREDSNECIGRSSQIENFPQRRDVRDDEADEHDAAGGKDQDAGCAALQDGNLGRSEQVNDERLREKAAHVINLVSTMEDGHLLTACMFEHTLAGTSESGRARRLLGLLWSGCRSRTIRCRKCTCR